jgi:hypothetical protein
VLEIASFAPLTEQQNALLQEVANIAALALEVLLRNVKTRDLLDQVRTTEAEPQTQHSAPQAAADAGAVRFRPMLLTASSVVVGASVMLADPIFKGLAVSLMAGEISLLISRMAVPVLYFMARNRAALESGAPDIGIDELRRIGQPSKSAHAHSKPCATGGNMLLSSRRTSGPISHP